MVEFKIESEKEQPLLKRTEVCGLFTYEKAVPSMASALEQVAEKKKVSVDVVRVDSIYPRFGTNKADVKAYIYQSKEARDKSVVLTHHIRKKLNEGKPVAEQPKKGKKKGGK